MKALEYRFSLPQYVATRSAGKRGSPFWYGRWSGLRLVHRSDPQLPDDEWSLLEPILSGVCGSDTALLAAKTSPVLEPFASFPAVLGHEVVARVLRPGRANPLAGSAHRGAPLREGQRVVVDPFLHCVVRGLDRCENCRLGLTSACRNFSRGRLAPALLLGTCRDLPGTWSHRMIAHPSQIFLVPDVLSDETAVLIEPLSVAIHGVLRSPPDPKDSVLVIGGGTIGLCTVAALRLLGSDAHITLLGRHPFQRELARQLGADEVLPAGRDTALNVAAARSGSELHQPILGRAIPDWGFDRVYDCVGTRHSLDDGLRTTRPGGSFVLLGCAGEIPRLDWTLVWSKELQVYGSCGYGVETWHGQRMHTFQLAFQLLKRHPHVPLSSLVTHAFPLEDYPTALRAAFSRQEFQAVKVVFTPGI